MFKRIADELSLMLAANKVITLENREAYAYGLELFLFKITLYIIIAVISIVAGAFVPSLFFVASYMLLRQYGGGYHCKTAGACMIVSVAIYIIFLSLYKLDKPYLDIILLSVSVISAFPIIRFSPVENKNNPITVEEKRKYHIITSVVTAVLVIISVIAYLVNLKIVFLPISYALTADAVLILFGQRRNNNEKVDYEGNCSSC